MEPGCIPPDGRAEFSSHGRYCEIPTAGAGIVALKLRLPALTTPVRIISFSCMKQPIMTRFILSPKNLLEVNMKIILSMLLLLGFCGLARAQGEKTDMIGTWKCEYEIGDQKR